MGSIYRSRPVLCKILLTLFVLLFASQADAKRERKTRTLVLSNGLSVYLMSDSEVSRSAAALSVGVGHLYDPIEKQGLAHYLEHMLFLGTEKFPDVEDYKKYLNSNSGRSNAYTGGDITNYFFQVAPGAFDGAMDRFSQFFKAPLFSPKYAEREVNAVNSEFDKNRLQDGWRANHLVHQISEPGHPLGKFGIGNKDTLSGDNRPDLLKFHKQYYSASIMKLAVLSSLSLSEQEKMVRNYFSDLPSHPVELPKIDPNFRKPLDGKYRLLRIKSIKDKRSLGLEFPTIRLDDHKGSKPASVVSSVIGHEGKGSLLSKLKEEGLALGLSAGGGSSHPDISTFDINVKLTQKGEKEYQRVLELIFAYFDMLRQNGFEQYTFLESKRMAEINLKWRELQEGMGFVAGQSALMQDYPLEEIETTPYLFTKEDKTTYRAILETLRPENMLAVLSSQAVKTDKKEKFFGTEYSLEEVGGEAFTNLKNPVSVEGMGYPEKNDFLPEQLVLHTEHPHLIRDDDMAKVYFQFDNRFEKPKAYIKMLIETPHVYDEPGNLARSKLYEASIMEGLNELTYPISQAGLSYAMSLEKRGVVLTVGGYSERLHDLLKLVAQNLLTLKIDEQKFKDIKDEFVRGVQNGKLGAGYRRASYFNQQIWLPKQYTEEQLLEGLTSVSFDEVKRYAGTLFKRVYITAVVNGNWTEDKARESVDLVVRELRSEPLPEAERFENVVTVLGDAEQLRYSEQVADNNNALFYTLQYGAQSLKSFGESQLIASIVESDFYTQMRTNQQLGYIVWSFGQRLEDRLFFKMIIQSAGYGPFELEKRVSAWMKGAPKLFDDLSDAEFEKHRNSLIVSLEKKPDSIAETAGNMYYFAIDEKGDFDYKKKLIEVVKGLKKSDVVASGKRLFEDANIPRSVVMVRSNSNGDNVPDGVLTSIDQIKKLNKKRTPAL